MIACMWSHPSRGAWIEIGFRRDVGFLSVGRTPHGVRGLKSIQHRPEPAPERRTPHGVRGLKSMEKNSIQPIASSHPSRGAWIEIDKD